MSKNNNTIVQPILMGGKEVYPLIDGGKGISFTNGVSAGLWAKCGGIGTISVAAADRCDEFGNPIPYTFLSNTRAQRHEELIQQEINGGIYQIQKAYELAQGNGLININILWDMGGSKRILAGILEHASHMINGITAGAGIPYELAELAAQYNLGFLPIVSSLRVTKILWARAYGKYKQYLQAVVYEDPWKAGGHNGISNQEDPTKPESPLERLLAIRKFLNEQDCAHIPIIMAGNVWHLDEWSDYLHNPDLQPLAFQFGTRTLVTQENPSKIEMKMKYLEAGDTKTPVHLHNFSPTGMWSSALENDFLRNLIGRKNRQIKYTKEANDNSNCALEIGARKRIIYLTQTDYDNAQTWIQEGYTQTMHTPDDTYIFVTPEDRAHIIKDQQDCKGCLKGCKFSNWYESKEHNNTTGNAPDPRSFCIFNTLYGASHGKDINNELLFAGHTVNRFSADPFYRNPDNTFRIPTIEELFNRILTGK